VRASTTTRPQSVVDKMAANPRKLAPVVAGRAEKGRALDELCKVTGWHRKHAVRALADRPAAGPDAAWQRTSTYGVIVKDALTALWRHRTGFAASG
jgi:hypothetical protein